MPYHFPDTKPTYIVFPADKSLADFCKVNGHHILELPDVSEEVYTKTSLTGNQNMAIFTIGHPLEVPINGDVDS